MKLGVDADVALTEVSTKVSSIRGELPAESEDPVIAKQAAEGFALAYYSFYSDTLSPTSRLPTTCCAPYSPRCRP